MKEPVFVTRPALPPLDDFMPYLERIWESKVLTNGGEFHRELEKQLADYLGVKYISLFNNATIGLMSSLEVLELSGEVITTPFSFVATASSIAWNHLTPVFVDIDPITFGINPQSIEEAITPKTCAILGVHCYGQPCNTAEISKIAQRYNLKVIYDAAHAFGVKDHKQQSILLEGDISVLSFHATKVFNTFEGGALVCQSLEMKQKIDRLRNFGLVGSDEAFGSGINGKMSEVNAAFGLLQLKHVGLYIQKRSQIYSIYMEKLKDVSGVKVFEYKNCVPNYSYFPIIIEESFKYSRDEVFDILKSNNIICRKYFFPLISDFHAYKHFSQHNLENAKRIASNVICLPMYPDLGEDIINHIVGVFKLMEVQ